MENQFTNAMSKLSDAELLLVAGEQKGDYVPEAIIAAEAELQKRNLTVLQVEAAATINEQMKLAKEEKSKMPLSNVLKIIIAFLPGLSLFIIGTPTIVLRAEGYTKKADDIARWKFYGYCFYGGILLIIILYFTLIK